MWEQKNVRNVGKYGMVILNSHFVFVKECSNYSKIYIIKWHIINMVNSNNYPNNFCNGFY